MKFTFERLLIFIFVAFLMGITVTGFLTYESDMAFQKSTQWVRHTEEVLQESDRTLTIAKDISGERAYLSTGDSSFLEPYINATGSIFIHLGILKQLTKDNIQQRQRIDSLTLYARNRVNIVANCVQLINEGKKEEAAAIINTRESKFWMDKIRATIDEMQMQEGALLNYRKQANDESLKNFNRISIALISALLLLTILTFLAVRHTLLKRTTLEREVRETNRFLNTILEYIPNMIFVKDARDLRFVRFNRAGEKLLGRSRDEMMGKNDYDFFPSEQADFFTGKDKEVILKGELADIPEEPIKTAYGSHWLHTKKIPILDESGKPLYLLGISEDITERKHQVDEIKELNDQLGKTVAQLVQANKEMEAFTYSVSHDLRAPLRIIDGFGEILLNEYEDKLDAEAINTLKVIRTNAKHMGQLIDDLLNLSRLGRAQLTVKPVEMRDMVMDVVEALKMMEKDVRADIQVKMVPNNSCDPSLIRQVWINLIANAIKYSSKSLNPLVEIGSFRQNDETVYYVKDNGVGFDMKYVHKLFGVFQRLHKISEFEGTGVGLALVHRIISRHGGKVWTEAEIDKGATFYFTLRT